MSERELLHTDRVLVVEGKYDAARLSHLTDAMILLTDGFGIYKDKKRQQLLKALAKKNGLILFTDSDAAGFLIRTYITGLVGAENVVQAYVPPSMARKSGSPSLARKACWAWKAWTMPSSCNACGMHWAQKPGPRLPARRVGRSPTPICTTGGFPAPRAVPSGNTSCSTRWACRPGSPKRSWWRR